MEKFDVNSARDHVDVFVENQMMGLRASTSKHPPEGLRLPSDAEFGRRVEIW